MKEPKLAKSDAALLDIRKALETGWPPRLPVKTNAWVQDNVPKRERAKFKSFLLTVQHLGDVSLEKAARRAGVSKELLAEWMNAPEISKCVNRSLNSGRRLRAAVVLSWAKIVSKQGRLTLKARLTKADSSDSIDYGNMLPPAKEAALDFNHPELFRLSIEMVLAFHKYGGRSSAKQFFINLGKCLSHGIRGTRGINPKMYDKLDLDIADIILSHDPPISDKDAAQELRNRGHWLGAHLPMLEIRFRKAKHRLLLDAWPADRAATRRAFDAMEMQRSASI